MDIDPIKATSELTMILDAYGPWAVMAVTIIVAFCVVIYVGQRVSKQVVDLNAQIDQKNTVIQFKEDQIEAKDEQLLALLEGRHEEFKGMMEETVRALSTASDTNQRLIILMDRCERAYNGQR